MPLECGIIFDGIPEGAISRKVGLIWGIPDESLLHHEAVRHGVREYVRDDVHTNGIEGFWSLLKRGYNGVYHYMSPKHLARYVAEFTGRQNSRFMDTTEQLQQMFRAMDGKRLRYRDLVA